MNTMTTTPTATPRTDAECIQIYTEDVTGCVDAVDCVCASFARELEKELARLRADNLTAHQMACAARLERDRLRAEVEQKSNLLVTSIKSAGDQAARAERAEAERDALANVERLTTKIANQAERIRYLEGATNHATGTPLSIAVARAERAEAELATERARLDSGQILLRTVSGERVWHCGVDLRAALAATKEDAP